MANEESSSSESRMNEKLLLIEKKFEELKSATKTAVWGGRLVLLIIAVVIVVQILMLFNAVTQYEKQAYVDAAQAEMSELAPKILEQAGDLAERVAPVYEKAFMKEFKEGMPEIAEVFSRELDVFVNNVGSNVNRSLENRFQEVLDKQLDMLAEDIPEIKDDQKRAEIMEAATDTAYSAAQRLSREMFSEQIEVLYQIRATLDSAAIPKEITEMSDEQLVSYTGGKVGDLLLVKMAILEDVFDVQSEE